MFCPMYDICFLEKFSYNKLIKRGATKEKLGVKERE